MTRTRKTAAAIATMFALSVCAVPAAAAEAPPTEPCARQQAQVTKAEEALARVTAVFEHQQDKAQDARKAARKADTRAEKAAARAALERALDRKADAAKEKKAQQQRLAHAMERLAACESPV